MITTCDVTIEPPIEGAIVQPTTWFEEPGELEIEIGCGKGGFLLHRAKTKPELRLLGIEWASKYHRSCSDRMARWGIENVRVMRTDARIFVMHHLPPQCLSLLHLYHPDPWPKKRHHKRRLVQGDFVEALLRVFKPGGGWLIQSDHQEYMEHINDVLSGFPQLKPISWEQATKLWTLDHPATNFEAKYRLEGRDIFRAAYTLSPGFLGDPPT